MHLEKHGPFGVLLKIARSSLWQESNRVSQSSLHNFEPRHPWWQSRTARPTTRRLGTREGLRSNRRDPSWYAAC